MLVCLRSMPSRQDEILNQARQLKKSLPPKETRLSEFPSEMHPVSVFMAGSPGAGKTETARRLIEMHSKERSVVHIDPDRIRSAFPTYTGDNAELFQGAVSILADRIQDLTLKKSQSFVFDGTLSNFARAKRNIDRSLCKGREVYVIYVYQDPFQAWKFVQDRVGIEDRKIPKEGFIYQYFASRRTVNELIRTFGSKVVFEMIQKDINGKAQYYYRNFKDIDAHIPERYSEEELRNSL